MNESQEHDNSIRKLEKACRSRGIPLTVQRRVVLELLAQHGDHPSAEEIYREVAGRLPGISRTTVYRTLETLVRLGLARRVSHPGGTARFDPITRRHHHLVCIRCGRIFDWDDPRLDALPLPEMRLEDFEISDFSIHFEGRCGECRRNDVNPT